MPLRSFIHPVSAAFLLDSLSLCAAVLQSFSTPFLIADQETVHVQFFHSFRPQSTSCLMVAHARPFYIPFLDVELSYLIGSNPAEHAHNISNQNWRGIEMAE